MDITIESFDFGIPERRAGEVRTVEEAQDDQLVLRAQQGCDEAFCRLVGIHQERVYHFCNRWLQDEENAREATQDTFIRVYEALPRYRKGGKFTTWLYRIALNLCRDHFRSKRAKQQRATQPLDAWHEDSICSGTRPDESAVEADQRARMREAVMDLPDKLRATVILFAFEELSQEECAEILNCSVRAIEGRLYRSRNLLQEARDRGQC